MSPASAGGLFTTEPPGKPSVDACVAPTVLEGGDAEADWEDRVPFSHDLYILVGDTFV